MNNIMEQKKKMYKHVFVDDLLEHAGVDALAPMRQRMRHTCCRQPILERDGFAGVAPVEILSHGGMVSLAKQTVPKQANQVIVEYRKHEVCSVSLCVALIHYMRPFNLFVELQALICRNLQTVRPAESVCQLYEI